MIVTLSLQCGIPSKTLVGQVWELRFLRFIFLHFLGRRLEVPDIDPMDTPEPGV